MRTTHPVDFTPHDQVRGPDEHLSTRLSDRDRVKLNILYVALFSLLLNTSYVKSQGPLMAHVCQFANADADETSSYFILVSYGFGLS